MKISHSNGVIAANRRAIGVDRTSSRSNKRAGVLVTPAFYVDQRLDGNNYASVDASTSAMRATWVMKENNIRRLPVLSHGKLVGIITDRDLKETASCFTSDIDIHEMYYRSS